MISASDSAPVAPTAIDPLVTPDAEALVPSSHGTLLQFIRFGCVGGLGFVWDAGTVYALRPLLGLSLATLLAYFVAASANWVVNRLWTFRKHSHEGSLFQQWLRFLGANSAGFALNRSAVYTLFLTIPLCVKYPVLALAVGATSGLVANFALSRRLVFKVKR